MRKMHSRSKVQTRVLSMLLALAMLIGMLPSTVFAVGGSKPKDLKFNFYRLETSNENTATPIETITDFSMTANMIDGKVNENQVNFDRTSCYYDHELISDPWKFVSNSNLEFVIFASAYGYTFRQKDTAESAQLSIQVQVDEAGKYEITPLFGKSNLSAIIDVYVAPESAENKTAAEYKVGSADTFSATGTWDVPTPMEQLDLTAGIYEVTFKIVGGNAGIKEGEKPRALIGGINFIGVESSDVPVVPSEIKAELVNGVLEMGAAQQLKITDGSGNALTGATITCESSDADVATVDNDGNVTPVKMGKADIKVSADFGGTVREATVTIPVVGENMMIVDGVNHGKFENGIEISPGGEQKGNSFWKTQLTAKGEVLENSPLAYDGSNIVKIVFDNNTQIRSQMLLAPNATHKVSQYMKVDNTKLYEFSGFLKHEGIVEGRNPAMKAELYFYNGPTGTLIANQQINTLEIMGKDIVGDNDWTYFSTYPVATLDSAVVAANTRFISKVGNVTTDPIEGTVYASNFSFHEVIYDEMKLAVEGTTVDMPLDATAQITATHFSNTGKQIKEGKTAAGAAVPIAVSYESSAPAVAEVDATGKITAKGDGSATITAKATIAGVEKTATVNVTVKDTAATFKPDDLKFNFYRLENSNNNTGTPIESVTDFAMTANTINGVENINQINFDRKKSAYGYEVTSDPWKYASKSNLQFVIFANAYGYTFRQTDIADSAQLSIQVQVDEAGKYEITPLFGKTNLSGIIEVYVAPENAENKTAAEYKVGTADTFADTGVFNVPAPMAQRKLTAGVYEVTFKLVGGNAGIKAGEKPRALIGGINFIGVETPVIAETETQTYNLMANNAYVVDNKNGWNKEIKPLKDITFDNVMTLGGTATDPWAYGGFGGGSGGNSAFNSTYGYQFNSQGTIGAWEGIKVRVPQSGYYTPELMHGTQNLAIVKRIYLAPDGAENPRDAKYSIGHIDTYQATGSNWEARAKFETVYLEAGDYLMSFEMIGKNEAHVAEQTMFYLQRITLYGVNPDNMPTFASLTAADAGVVFAGASKNVALTATMTDSSIEDLWSATITATPEDSSIATAEVVADAKNFSREIKISGVTDGKTNIHVNVTLANGESKSVSIPVTVEQEITKPLDHVYFAMPGAFSGEIAVKTSHPTELILYDADDTAIKTTTAKVTYTVEPEGLASVDENGNIVALTEGTGTITASVTLGDVTKTDSISVNIGKAGENLLAEKNPGFESGNLNPWNLTENTSATESRNVQVAAMPKDGKNDNKALKVSYNKDVAVKLYDAMTYKPAERVKLEAGRFYELSFWVKVENLVMPEDPGDGFVLIGCDMYGYTDQTDKGTLTGETYRGQDLNKLENFPAIFGEWKKVTLNIAAPLTKDQYITPRFVADIRNATGKTGFGVDVYYDDFELREVGFDTVALTASGDNSVIDGVSQLTIQPLATTGTPIMMHSTILASAVKVESSDTAVATVGNVRPTVNNGNNTPTIADVTTKGTGSTDIKATVTLNGIERSMTLPLTISELKAALKSIELTVPTTPLSIGQTDNASVTGTMTNDQAADLTKATIAYTSSNTDVATVDNDGKITGVSEGETEITVSVTLDGKNLTAKKTVNVIDNSNLTAIDVKSGLPEGEDSLKARSTTTLVVTGTMSSGRPAYMPNATITYAITAGEDVVSVDDKGVVKGLKEGDATIEVTVSMHGGAPLKKSISINVIDTVENYLLYDFKLINDAYNKDSRLMKYTDTNNTWEFDNCSDYLKGGTLIGWQPYGINLQGNAVNQFGSFRIMVNEPGIYDATLTHALAGGGGQMRIFIAPASVPAADRTAMKYSVGTTDCYAKDYNAANKVKMDHVTLQEAGEYVVTFLTIGKTGGSWGYCMYPGALELNRIAYVGDVVREDVKLNFAALGSEISPLNDLNITDYGFEINKELTSEYAMSLGDGGFRIQSYGLQSQVSVANTPRDSDTAIDFNVPVGGPFLLSFSGGKYPAGGIANIYIDGLYAGTYDFYHGTGTTNGGTVNMRSFDLSEGRHTILFRTVGQSEGSQSCNQYIGNIVFSVIDEMPTFDTLTATVSKNKLSVGEKASLNIEAVMSTGTIVSFGNKIDGSEDENLKLTVVSSNDDIVSVDENRNVIPKSEGSATITVTAVVDGATKTVEIPVNVTDSKISNVDVTVTPSEIYAGKTAVYAVVATLDNGEVIDNSNLTISAESSDANVFTVSDSSIHAVAAGSANLTVKVVFNGRETTKTIPINVLSPSFSSIEVTSDKIALRPGEEYAQLTVVGKTNIGEVQDLTGATIQYTSKYPNIASVTEDGIVLPISLGLAVIDVTVTLNGVTVTGSVSISVSNGKSASSFYTEEKVAAARENVQKYSWARTESDKAESAANKYIGKEDDLWNLVTQEGLPRGATVGFQDDPNAYTCAYCGVDLRAKYSVYPWISDPLNTPWKVQCPDCRRFFPSNDFGNYYKLGIDENGKYNKDLAKAKNDELVAKGEDGYLKNILYPEKGEGWGVDDGYGYKTGTVFSNGVTESKTWIAYYNHWGLWYTTGGNNAGLIGTALNNLRNAYLYTGDIRYGRVGAILVDRVADVYPDFDLLPYFSGTDKFYNSHGMSGEGKTIGRIWETSTARDFALAYDAFYPVMDDPYVVNFLAGKAAQYNFENTKESGELIRQNGVDGILRSIYEGCKTAQIYGNFGMHQETLATAAVVLDTMPETKEWIDWVMQEGGYVNNRKVTGGNVLVQLVNNINRDGHGEEGAPGYNNGWLTNVLQVAEATKGYETYEAADLYKNPKLIKMISSFNQMTLGYAGRYYATAQIGDSGSAANYKTYISASNSLKGYSATRDPLFAQMLYWANNDSVDGIHESIFTRNPEAIQEEIRQIIKTQGELNLADSYNMAGNGFTILRDGEFINSDNAANIVDTRRDFWLYYGRNAGHGHPDALNLGIEAYGMNMAPELGYPEATGNDPNRAQWINNTISHNTVVVNETKQASLQQPAKILHYDDAGNVKLMDVDSPLSYAATDIYRRTVVMVEVSDEVSYGIDFFRIKGGYDHTYSFHSQSKEIYETEGLSFVEQKDANGEWVGSYAGADVAWGANSNYMNGYSWLKKVRKAANPQTGTFAVDFKITDFREVLPYDQDLHLRMTMLNDFDLSEVSIVEGTPPRISGNPDAFEYVLARRKGKVNDSLDSLFTTVYEPYKDERYIASLEAVADENITIQSGTEGKNDVVRAVKVTLTDGRIDYIVYATNNTVLYNIDGVFDFRGVIGVYSTKNGQLHTAYVNDGDVIGAPADSTAAYTGTVVDFTRELAFDNTITVKINGNYDIDRLAGEFIYVNNGKSVGNAVYPIESATRDASGNVVLSLGNTTLIDKYIDGSDLTAGYQYNIAQNDSFRIPLGNKEEIAPIFDKVGEKSTEVGAMLTFAVSATSPVGREVTISASSLPYGAQFDSETGIFTWSPSFGSIGVNNAKFVATDGVNSTSLNVPITVHNSASGGGDKPIDNPSGGTGGGGGGSQGGVEPDPDPKPEIQEDEVSFVISAQDDSTASTELGSVTFENGYFAEDGQGKLTIKKENDQFDISLNTQVKTGEGLAKVSLNFKPSDEMLDKNCIIVRDADGNIIPGGRYADGKITFYTENLGVFNVDYNPKSFTDLGNHTWASEAIIRLAAREIIKGTSATTYSPANNITRADFTTLIVRAFGFSDEGASFPDVPANAYYAETVGIAKTLGIVGGDSHGNFNPMAPISRQDMMVIVARAAEKAGLDLSGDVEGSFSDADQVSDYAKEAVEMLIRSGIVAGANGLINPKGTTTRAEVAVILDRLVFFAS